LSRTLVIGAGGQIGSDLVPALAAQGHEVWMLDMLPYEATHARALLERALADDPGWRRRWIVGDVAAQPTMQLIEELAPDVIFHMAAILSAVGERDPSRCWDVNMNGLRGVLDVLARLAQDGQRRRIVWPSSIAAFGPLPGGDEPPRVPNEHPLLPTTMYGVTKVAGELLGAYYARTQGVDFRSLRFPGLLSATEPGGGSSDYANEMFFAAARGKRAVQVFVREDSRIPFMHMDDAVRALQLLSEADESALLRRTYNVSSFAPSAAEIAAAIEDLGHPLQVRYVPDPRQAIVDSWPDDMDDRAARADWGWAPRYDLAATTRRLIADIRQLDGAAPDAAPVERAADRG